jgi:choline dehydrogenase
VMFHQEGLGLPTAHAFGIGPCVLKPTSRGMVLPRSAQPATAPRILHNYLSTQEDRDSLVAGVRIAMDIASKPALQAVTTAAHEVPASDSEADILDFVRKTGMTLYHPTSTCSIGPVVDNELRVHGLRALRVVDASVMPSVPRGNTNAPTIMIAERAADLIRGLAPTSDRVAATT